MGDYADWVNNDYPGEDLYEELLRFTVKDPNKGYINNNLLLPKSKIHENRIKGALTFIHGEEIIYDANTGEPLRSAPGTLELWDETTHHLIVPREFLTPEQRKQFDIEFVDEREQLQFGHVDIGSSIQPRDEGQERALAALGKHKCGTLTLSCGRGKTVIALARAAELGVPTIVIVNTTALLEQWKEEIQNHLDVKSVGIVQRDVADWEGHPIVVAMVHTLSARRDTWSMEFRRRFGIAIYDECFPAGTLVGGKPIEKIEQGDVVPSYDLSTRKTILKRVVRTFRNPVNSLVRLHTDGRTTAVTPSHPFLTRRRGLSAWINAGSLQRGDMVRSATIEHENSLRSLWCSDKQKEITKSDALLRPVYFDPTKRTAEAGQKKNDLLEWVRVDSVEVLEQGSDGTFGGLCPDGFVYNLEVEDTHTYLANGFVVHNCHHMAAPVFVKSADLFFGCRYSLTATPKRTDGLEMIYQHHLGKVIHSNLEQDLIPTSWFHALYWEMSEEEMEEVVDINGSVNLNKVRTFLGRLDWRNNIICDDLRFDLASGRKILVLSHSVEHVERLYRPFRREGAGMIIGDTPQEERMDILRECNPVFGTFQLAREGLNKPSLDTLYVTTPFSNANDLQQSWGRIQRMYADKKDPIVRVYEDRALNTCITSCRKLKKTLKKWGHPVRRRKINVIEES